MSWEDIFDEFAQEEEKPVEEETEAPPTEEAPLEEEAPAEEAEEFFGEEVKEEIEEGAEEAPPKPKPPVPTKEEKFDVSEDEGVGKEVYMLYGLKGEGKTALAMSFPGKIAVLSFDRKSLPVKQRMFKDKDIKVYDAIRYMNSSSSEMHLETSEKSFRYLNVLLSHIEENWDPDWIVIDGSEILQRMCEMTMRYRNNLMPFQGIANRNLWKERRMYIRQIHQRALGIAKRGLIYTTYTTHHEVIKEGEFVTKKEVPRWIDAILYETDCVVKVEANREKSGQRFYAEVESSKATLPTGAREDVTDVGIKAFFKKGGD